MRPDHDLVRTAVEAVGFRLRGAFHHDVGDAVPGVRRGTVVLVGGVGPEGFDAFRASAEHADGLADPLDRYSERIIDGLAASLRARALYPHRGPPWLPFQRWAARAEPVSASPLGVLVHPRHGLWHAYRGALVFDFRLGGLPRRGAARSPCETCAARPCLSGCPVGAFSESGFDADACTRHLASAAGRTCVDEGCQARLACPVAPDLRYRGEQARFHMRAFARAQGVDLPD